MKALGEHILMVLFVFLLKRVHYFLQIKPKGVTIQMKALDEHLLMVLFVFLLKGVHYFCIFQNSFGQRTIAVKG